MAVLSALARMAFQVISESIKLQFAKILTNVSSKRILVLKTAIHKPVSIPWVVTFVHVVLDIQALLGQIQTLFVKILMNAVIIRVMKTLRSVSILKEGFNANVEQVTR